jgi:hypothetical protein
VIIDDLGFGLGQEGSSNSKAEISTVCYYGVIVLKKRIQYCSSDAGLERWMRACSSTIVFLNQHNRDLAQHGKQAASAWTKFPHTRTQNQPGEHNPDDPLSLLSAWLALLPQAPMIAYTYVTTEVR